MDPQKKGDNKSNPPPKYEDKNPNTGDKKDERDDDKSKRDNKPWKPPPGPKPEDN